MPRMKVGLVLSGGGARCFAQIGALQALEDHGVEVTAIAANSTAAFIGAFFATGHSAAAIHKIVTDIDYSALLDFKGGGGMMGHEGIMALLREHVPATFEELKLPLVVPAVDIQSAERVVFSTGELVPALCATNAFPGVFRPVTLGKHELVDGGLLSNVPLDLIRPLTPAPVFVVDTRPSPTRKLELPSEDAGAWERLRTSFEGGVPLTAKVLEKAYTITQSRLIELTYAMHPPDYVVTPDLGDDFEIQDFGRLDKAYKIGLRDTRRELERIEAEVIVRQKVDDPKN